MPSSSAYSSSGIRIREGVLPLFSLVILALGLGRSTMASPTATITGRVTDSLGGSLAGALVEVTNVETNTVVRTKTNQRGLYRVSNLQPGHYRVIVRMFGFRTMVKPGLRLHVQDVIGLNFSMQLGSAIASITQDEGVPLVQAETGMQSAAINQFFIANLPSLTRNPYDFVALSAGAAPTRSCGVGYALNGQRSESGSFLLDGSDNNNAHDPGPGQIVPLDVVEEYRLMTHNFTAEYGRNTGFIANVVTKNGTNDFHGAAYYFNRNSALAANTYENNARGIPRPVFNRQQMGGSAGGPLLRDKLFFYAAGEPILVRSSATLSYYVPTPDLLAVSSAGTNAMFSWFPIPSNLSRSDVSIRTVCPFGRFCGSTINSGFVTLPAFASTTRTGHVDAGAGIPQNTLLWTDRLDFLLNERSTLNVRYAFQDANQFATIAQPYSPELDQPSTVRNQNITLNLARFFSGSFFTESRAVFSRLFQQSPRTPATEFPSFTITGDTISGSAGSLSLPSARNAFGGAQSIYQLYQGGNWIRGAHNLKFGWQFQHLRDSRVPAERSLTRTNQGEFRDLQGFVDGFLTSYQLSLDPKGEAPGVAIQPPFGPIDFGRNYRFNDMAGFFQNTWKISSSLTLSPGLRYEYFGVGHRTGQEKALDASFYYGAGTSVQQRVANGRLLRTVEAPEPYRNHYFLPRRRNLAPRLGLAYGFPGSGRTVLRLGAGLFYERLPGIVFDNTNPPAFSIARLAGVSLTPALLDDPYGVFPATAMPVPPSVVTHLDQDLRTAWVGQWNVALEHELMRSLVLSGAYLGSRGNRLYRPVNVNRIGSGQFDGRPGERLFKAASNLTTIDNQARSSFHALQIKAESPGIRNLGLQFGANYTWSHSIDNASTLLGDNPSVSLFPLDAFDPRLDKGSSDHDIRHRMVGNFAWQIPFGSTSGTYRSRFLSGWELSGIVSFQAGQPFNLRDSRVADLELADTTRPRLTGPAPAMLRDTAAVPDARIPNAFLLLPLNHVRRANGSCLETTSPFGCQFSVNGPFTGSLGRNVFRRPGTHFQNIAFIKNLDLPSGSRREALRLQIRAEFYNLFNHSNLYFKPDTANVGAASFNGVDGTSVPGVLASFGTPERSPQEARQLVLAVKLIF